MAEQVWWSKCDKRSVSHQVRVSWWWEKQVWADVVWYVADVGELVYVDEACGGGIRGSV